MFEEYKIVEEIKKVISDSISTAVNDKKMHDKKFMASVISYQKTESDKLINVINKFAEMYTAAITHASDDACELSFEEAYCKLDENNISSIENFMHEYAKTNNSSYERISVTSLFSNIKKFPATVALLETVVNYYNYSDSEIKTINLVIEFINSLK